MITNSIKINCKCLIAVFLSCFSAWGDLLFHGRLVDFIGVLLHLMSRMTEACWYLSLIAVSVFMFDDLRHLVMTLVPGNQQGIQDNRPLAPWVIATVPSDADHISSEVQCQWDESAAVALTHERRRWYGSWGEGASCQSLAEQFDLISISVAALKTVNICHALTGSFLQFDWQLRLIAWVTLRNKLNCFYLCQEEIW